MLRDGIGTISFDVGFTLIYTDPPVGEVYADVAGRFGYRLDGGEVHQRFKATWKEKNGANRLKRDGNAQADETRSYRWWKDIFSQAIGDTIKPGDLDPMFDLCYHEYAKGKYWKLYPEVRETLTRLRSGGFRLVVLSNWDHRLNRTLKELELEPFFDKIYISSQIGFAKPDPDAFRHVLSDLGIKPHALLHVGDTLQEDIAGAREAGIPSVCIDRDGKYPAAAIPKGTPIITRLSQLTGDSAIGVNSRDSRLK
jgi:putative hydrolase of the HAD superfamily